jgi:Zn-dependent protease
MTWSITLFSVGGTAVRMHLTFLLLLGWIAAAQWMNGTAQDAIAGVAFIIVLFACVVLHEFGHIAAGRRYGIRTPDVTLWPIGGVASMERMPEKPSQEIVVALAGPAVNAAIAFVLIVVLGFRFDLEQMTPIEIIKSSFFAQIAVANIVLLVFNLIPAFPMDGGRVLRAVLAMKMGNARATQVAATVGQVLAVVFAILGLMGNPLLVLIALFIFLAARGEAGYAQLREATRGRPVTDAMITSFQSLGVMATANDAAQLLLQTTQRTFPVLDGASRLRGVVTRKAVIDALKKGDGASTPVLKIMTTDVPTLPQHAGLEQAFAMLRKTEAQCVGVVDPSGRLVGYITPGKLSELVIIRNSREQRASK